MDSRTAHDSRPAAAPPGRLPGAVALPAAWAFLSGAFLLGMEWLFLVTKPSFLSGLGVPAQARVLFSTLPAALLPAALAALFVLPALAAKPGGRAARLLGALPLAPAALALGSSLLLLADNFTYTLFGAGVLSADRPWNHGYALAHVALVIWSWRALARSVRTASPSRRLPILGAAAALLAIGAALAAAAAPWRDAAGESVPPVLPGRAVRTPNVLVLIGDGIAASRTSLYGYEHDTTPYLRALAAESVVAENCVAASAQTFTSTAMLLTGRPPTATRMIFTDILQGADAYRHLPGVLRGLGYRSIGISIRHYGDPFEMNMLHSFDRANYRDAPNQRVGDLLAGLLGQRPAYLLQEVLGRITDRLGYAFAGVRPDTAFEEATQRRRRITGHDGERLDELRRFLEQPSPRPFFAYVHLQGTHGPRWEPRRQVFSGGAPRKGGAEADYQDALLDFDDQVRDLMGWLRGRGLDEKTLVVVLSDHGRRHSGNQRVPLLVRFPGGRPVGRIRENTQLTDVAPTILDYIGLRQPPWMEGVSLLAPAREGDRPIFGAGPVQRLSRRALKPPPYFGLSWMSVTLCDRNFTLDVASGRVAAAPIAGHTAPCAQTDDGMRRARELLRSRLLRDGYPVPAALRDPAPSPGR